MDPHTIAAVVLFALAAAASVWSVRIHWREGDR